MSTSTQEKFLAKMAALADELELDLVVDYTYANNGQMRFEKKEQFEAVVSLGFHFQTGYASFTGFEKFKEDPSYVGSDGRRHLRGPHVTPDQLEETTSYIYRELMFRHGYREIEKNAAAG